MINHFETALNNPNFMEKYKDNPIHIAILHAFCEYTKQGNSILDLPWFAFAKDKKEETT